MEPNSFDYVLMHPNASAPKRAHPDDVGYDLVALEALPAAPGWPEPVTLLETGVSVRPPPGFYFDLVPRSSLAKTGYMLANGIGVIDPAYQGSIKVPLIRVDPNAPPLQLPARLVQLVPRRVHALEPVQRPMWEQATERGAQGFGSTGRC